ncbi:DUF4442 domain-containing protein [Mesonia aestuariivivens]|uniref:DUF4442 domain-containing protein n=1 Tax=Mesonia aestuariivivens TaxID=2796128 RepID=A0ABS6VYD7_9FLAO|nr:DUF4442 domain-containing protein [Mesonia aestuariivivens]MBW2960616.1 DUF4442 domain-containing protein [Mesonia aestuariivivens]
MKFSPKNIYLFTMLKLPSAWICGVRLTAISSEKSIVKVKHRWINQNPFQSIYFAVQAMAAELSTGALVMQSIETTHQNISMLVAENNASFSKKATGRITFKCKDGLHINTAIAKTITSKESQTCWMKSIGKNEAGEVVSEFNFKWTLKLKV